MVCPDGQSQENEEGESENFNEHWKSIPKIVISKLCNLIINRPNRKANSDQLYSKK